MASGKAEAPSAAAEKWLRNYQVGGCKAINILVQKLQKTFILGSSVLSDSVDIAVYKSPRPKSSVNVFICCI